MILLGFAQWPALAFRGEEGNSVFQADTARQQQAALVRTPKPEQLGAAETAGKAGVSVVWHDRLDTPASIRGSDLGRRQAFSGGKGLRSRGGGAYQEDAVAVLDNLATFYRISDAANEFAVQSVEPDEVGFHHVKLNQTYRKLRVVGGELIVHFGKEGSAYEVNGKYVPDITLNVTPKIDGAQAVRIARDDLIALGLPKGDLAQGPELVVLARDMSPQLAYELTLSYRDEKAGPGLWHYWIDGVQGKILLRYSNIQRISAPSNNGANATITGTILAGEGGQVTNVVGWRENTALYYLYSTNRNWRIANASGSLVYTDAGTYAYRATNNWGTSDRTEMSSANNFDLVQRYYKTVHNRNSFDNAGVLAQVNVHYGFRYVNAFWDPTAMQFFIGDGDGVEANSLAVLDVLGHEYTHAVTERTANLRYLNESGALNESFSDIFGACIEFFGQKDDRASYPNVHAGKADWLMGEDCWLTSTALRDMRNPSNTNTVGVGNEQPSRYKGSFWHSDSADNGGVHQNSGPQNFFFYLLCDGGSGTNDGIVYSFPGIGVTNAEKVAYRALTRYCTANTDYHAVHLAWISAASDLNTNWVRTVKRAWNAVILPTVPGIYTDSALPAGRVGTAYSYALGAAGGEAPYSWQQVDGALPSGLTVSGGGVISGMPELEGAYSFKVAVTDNNEQTVTNQFSLTILPVHGIPFYENFESGGAMPEGWVQEEVTNSVPWSFLSGSPEGTPPSGHTNSAYNACLSIEADGKSVTRLVSPRIDFNGSIGQLTFWHFMTKWLGNQDELRVYYKTNATAAWQLIPGATYTASVTTWTERKLTLPNTSRTYYIAFEGTAKFGYGVCVDDVLVVDPTVPLQITTPGGTLPTATTDQYYVQALAATGGTPPYAFSLLSGSSLPVGMTLSSDGVISGTSTNAQTRQFTVVVTDSTLATASQTFTLAVDWPRADLFVETFEHAGQWPSGWVQEYVTNQVVWTIQAGGMYGHPSSAANGYYNAFLWSGAWSGGSSFDQKTRLVSPPIDLGQVPANARLTFSHCMEVWDSCQDELRVLYRTSATNSWRQLAVFTANVPSWTLQTVALTNLTSTYYIAFEGNAKFGHGICIDDVRISDSAVAPIIMTSTPLPSGVLNIPYSQTLTAVGGKEPYTWTVVVPSALPAGLSLGSGNGVISGTPTVGGLYTFRVQVMGSDGKTSVNNFSLRIANAFPIPFRETFENGGSIPFGWTQSRVTSSLDWIFQSGSVSGTPGASHAGGYNACLYADVYKAKETMLISPMIDLGASTPNTRLTFWHFMANYEGNQDELRVYYRTSVSGSWILLTNYLAEVSEWTQQTVSLPNPSSTYYIAFKGTTKYGYGVCIDDVVVTGDIPETPYQAWLKTKLSAGAIAAGVNLAGTDDFDGDGIVNALEYAYGLNPGVPDTVGLPTGGVLNNYLYLTYRENMAATDVVFLVEACTSLVENAWTTNGVSKVKANSNTWWQVLAWHDVPVTNAPVRFLRLKVNVP